MQTIRLPLELVYYEEYDRIDDAFNREKQIQGWTRKKKMALITGTLEDLHLLAECKNSSHFRNWGGSTEFIPSAVEVLTNRTL